MPPGRGHADTQDPRPVAFHPAHRSPDHHIVRHGHHGRMKGLEGRHGVGELEEGRLSGRAALRVQEDHCLEIVLGVVPDKPTRHDQLRVLGRTPIISRSLRCDDRARGAGRGLLRDRSVRGPPEPGGRAGSGPARRRSAARTPGVTVALSVRARTGRDRFLVRARGRLCARGTELSADAHSDQTDLRRRCRITRRRDRQQVHTRWACAGVVGGSGRSRLRGWGLSLGRGLGVARVRPVGGLGCGVRRGARGRGRRGRGGGLRLSARRRGVRQGDGGALVPARHRGAVGAGMPRNLGVRLLRYRVGGRCPGVAAVTGSGGEAACVAVGRPGGR